MIKTNNRKLSRLQKQRSEISARLFLTRCCIALICVVFVHLIEQSSISSSALALYVIGIPTLLWFYDRIFFSR